MIRKRTLIHLITASGILLSVGCTTDRSQENVTFDDLDAIRMLLPPLQSESHTFRPQTKRGRDVLTKVSEWINDAERVEGPVSTGKTGYAPTAHILLKNGQELVIKPALDCKQETLANGTAEKRCEPIPEEVVIRSAKDVSRYHSVKLSQWLGMGWERDAETDRE